MSLPLQRLSAFDIFNTLGGLSGMALRHDNTGLYKVVMLSFY